MFDLPGLSGGMARPLRIEYAGGCYHVINRGNYRQMIFKKQGAAEAFERTLSEAAVKSGWKVHAYAILGNHFHLAIELTEPNLSDGMKWLQGTWIRRFNRYRGWTGRPFQGRYKGLVVEPGHAFAQVCHYIHLNPFRAGLEKTEVLGEYRWSSLHEFPRKGRPPWLEPANVLTQAGGLRDTPGGWKKYRQYLEFLCTDDVQKKALVSERMSRGWCLGTREFVREMKDEAVKRGARLDLERFEGLEPGAINNAREVYWEDMLSKASELSGIDLKKLPVAKMAPEKCFLAAVMKQATTAPNRWIADMLEIGNPATASQGARRWLQNKEQKRKVEKLAKRLSGQVLQSKVKT